VQFDGPTSEVPSYLKEDGRMKTMALLVALTGGGAALSDAQGWFRDSTIDRTGGKTTPHISAVSTEYNGLLKVSCHDDTLEVALELGTNWIPGAIEMGKLMGQDIAIRRDSGRPVLEHWNSVPGTAFVFGPPAIEVARDLATHREFVVQVVQGQTGETKLATFVLPNPQVLKAFIAECHP
jgi:hypothetical protein